MYFKKKYFCTAKLNFKKEISTLSLSWPRHVVKGSGDRLKLLDSPLLVVARQHKNNFSHHFDCIKHTTNGKYSHKIPIVWAHNVKLMHIFVCDMTTHYTTNRQTDGDLTDRRVWLKRKREKFRTEGKPKQPAAVVVVSSGKLRLSFNCIKLKCFGFLSLLGY